MGAFAPQVNGAITSYTYSAMTALTVANFANQYVRCSDIGVNGSTWFCDGATFKCVDPGIRISTDQSDVGHILFGPTSATYSQTGTTVTVTYTAHGFTAIYNGCNIYLCENGASGLLTPGWFTNFTFVNANSFTCTSTVSQSTSGNIGFATTGSAYNLPTVIQAISPFDGSGNPLFRKIVTDIEVHGTSGATTGTFTIFGFAFAATLTNKFVQARLTNRLYGLSGVGRITIPASAAFTASGSDSSSTTWSGASTASLKVSATGGWVAVMFSSILVPI